MRLRCPPPTLGSALPSPHPQRGAAPGAAETCNGLDPIPGGPPHLVSPQSLSLCFDGSKNFSLLTPRGPTPGSERDEEDETGLSWLGLRGPDTAVSFSRQRSGWCQHSVSEGPAPAPRAGPTLDLQAPPKIPGFGDFFFLSRESPPHGGGGRRWREHTEMGSAGAGPGRAASPAPLQNGAHTAGFSLGLKEAHRPSFGVLGLSCRGNDNDNNNNKRH